MNHAKRPLATQRGTKKPKKPTKFGKMLPLLLPAVGGLRETTEHTTPIHYNYRYYYTPYLKKNKKIACNPEKFIYICSEQKDIWRKICP